MASFTRRKLALALLVPFAPSANAYCNVCRNGGDVNEGKSFDMTDPRTGKSYSWNCGFLAESARDLLPGAGGAAGEARLCALSQLWAGKECECSGDPLPPDMDVYDPNPACDMCARVSGEPARDFNYVPTELVGELVDTGLPSGRMPCGGLYYAMAQGILEARFCATAQRNTGGFCCNVPAVAEEDFADFVDLGGGGGEDDGVAKLFEDCSNRPCEGSYVCKTRFPGSGPVCSKNPALKKNVASIGGTAGRGGGRYRGDN